MSFKTFLKILGVIFLLLAAFGTNFWIVQVGWFGLALWFGADFINS